MIRVIGFSKENINYTVTYNQSARALNIESSLMCDDCKPYRESTACMVWLVDNDMLGEIECIFPIVTEADGDWISSTVEVIEGTPKLEVSFEEKNTEIAYNQSHMVLIFDKGKKADKKYISSNCIFYTFGNELIAIECIDCKLS